jgi:hypothetical protein
MTDARLHALHWTFFSEVIGKDFPSVYGMFSEWCESVPPEKMSDIFDMGDEMFDDESPYDDADEDDDSDDEESDSLYTEDEIWNDINPELPSVD